MCRYGRIGKKENMIFIIFQKQDGNSGGWENCKINGLDVWLKGMTGG
jgi:hypothetical protein